MTPAPAADSPQLLHRDASLITDWTLPTPEEEKQ